MEIDPTETLITGNWVLQGGKAVGDRNCDRIERLTSSHLVFIKKDTSGRDSLYSNPSDGAFWVRVYPQSQMQGGGPPELRRLSLDEAKREYGDLLPSEKSK
jgi:hypothetical protein